MLHYDWTQCVQYVLLKRAAWKCLLTHACTHTRTRTHTHTHVHTHTHTHTHTPSQKLSPLELSDLLLYLADVAATLCSFRQCVSPSCLWAGKGTLPWEVGHKIHKTFAPNCFLYLIMPTLRMDVVATSQVKIDNHLTLTLTLARERPFYAGTPLWWEELHCILWE